MAITFVAAGTADAQNNTNVTPGLPAGLQAGDLMIAFWCAVDNAAEGLLSNPVDGLWTTIATANGTLRARLAWKVAGGSESPVAFRYLGGAAGDTVLGQIAAFRGTDTVTPVDVTGSVWADTGANIGPIAGITPGVDDALVVVAGTRADDWTSVDTLTGDSLTWAEIAEPDTTTGSDAGLVWGYTIIEGEPVAITDKTFTVTGGASASTAGVVFSVEPGAVAAAAHPTGAMMGVGP